MDTTRRIEVLRQVPFFMQMNDAQLRVAGQLMDELHVPKDGTLFVEGEPGDTMALVMEGSLEIRKSPVAEAEIAIGSVYMNEVVGEMACIDPAHRSATVVAKQDSRVLTFSRSAFQELTEQSPRTAGAILTGVLGQLATRLRDANARIDLTLQRWGGAPGQLARPLPAHDGSSPVPTPWQGSLAGFEDFDQVGLDAIYRVSPPHLYPSGFVLCEEGAASDACWILAHGEVAVSRLCGREMRFLAALPPGAVMGQMGLIDGAPRSARLVVSEQSVLLRIDGAVFAGLLQASTPFSVRFLERIAVTGIRQLRTTTRSLASLLAAEPERLSGIPERARAEPFIESAQPDPSPGPNQAAGEADPYSMDRLRRVRAANAGWWMNLDWVGRKPK